ncbi:hypothetical protein FSP39_021041 [Pinctada imbricata]|uniref:Uncharacterized protein n=1 Tax=Pinctada imbricata TaxID=66713 RepID=A0AA88XQ31_PINIB|nr:hypothetical protein FSP39_021041 [Pinctada imbricata]
MGISGLTTFMDDNLHLFMEHRLQNTKIIIDGNNLYHLLYYDNNVDYVHGGDYDRFAEKTREFFTMLSSCGISPYLVFDGAYEVDDRKLNTVLDRFRKRLFSAHTIAKGGGAKILPILAYETFRQVLNAMKVPFVVSDFEADYDIAVLANHFECPVLSYDSDFYILPLSAGFIPFDSVNFSIQADENDKSQKYLLCRIYFVDKLTKHFPNLGRDLLPLLATLMGNDYIESSTFETFISRLPTPKESNSHFRIPKTKTRMLKYMNWLENTGSLKGAVESIVASEKTVNQEKLRHQIERSLQAFTLTEDGSAHALVEYLKNTDVADRSTHVDGYDGCKFHVPDWLKFAHRSGDVVMALKNILLSRRTFLQCQVEDVRLPTSYACSQKIREVTYGILLSEELEDKASKCVQEYDREVKNIKKNMIEPDSQAVKVSEVPKLSVEERQAILMHTLGVDSEDFTRNCSGVELLVCVIAHWILNATPKITQDHLKSLLVCVTFLHLKSSMCNDDFATCVTPGDEFSVVDEAFRDSETREKEKTIRSLGKFCAKPEHSKRNPLDILIIHAFAQFQTCLLAALHLNQLLLCPFPNLNPGKIFKGVFVYNLCQELQSRNNTDSYLRDMLGHNSTFYKCYQNLLSLVYCGIKEEQFQPQIAQPSISSKRKKKSKSRNSKSGKTHKGVTDDSLEGEECDQDNSTPHLQAACSLSNRFSHLCV